MNLNFSLEEMQQMIEDNIVRIKVATPLIPTISKDDEWNDPIYDH